MNAIFCLTSAVLFLLCYFPPNFRQLHAHRTKLQQLKEIDYVGFLLYSGGLVGLILGFG
jgi:hypothetical protein